MGLTLVTNLKFYNSVAKRLKLKVQLDNTNICFLIVFRSKTYVFWHLSLSEFVSWSFLTASDDMLLVVVSLIVEIKNFIVDCEILVKDYNYEKVI